MDSTSVTLLERVRDLSNQKAWRRFVDLYSPLLGRLARRIGVKKSELPDFLQDVLTRLATEMPRFRYDPTKSFRGWLAVVAKNEWLRQSRNQRMSEVSAYLEDKQLHDKAARDPADKLAEEEFRAVLTKRAVDLMKTDFEEKSWRAFWLTEIEEQPVKDVAVALGLTENAIYLAKGRILRRLQQEFSFLID